MPARVPVDQSFISLQVKVILSFKKSLFCLFFLNSFYFDLIGNTFFGLIGIINVFYRFITKPNMESETKAIFI